MTTLYICDKKKGACKSYKRTACKSPYCNHTSNEEHRKILKCETHFTQVDDGARVTLWEHTNRCQAPARHRSCNHRICFKERYGVYCTLEKCIFEKQPRKTK